MPYRENAFHPSEELPAVVDDDVEVGPVMFRAADAAEARLPLFVFWLMGVCAAVGVVAGFAAWHH